MRLAIPIIIGQLGSIITGLADTIMVGWLGSLELAAHQIVIAISTVSFTIYLGLGSPTPSALFSLFCYWL